MSATSYSNGVPISRVARALYYFPGDQEDDLAFEAGDLIDVYEWDNDDWWTGKSRCTGCHGSFPSSLVEVISESAHPPRQSGSDRGEQDRIPSLPARPSRISTTNHSSNDHDDAPPSPPPASERNLQHEILSLMQEVESVAASGHPSAPIGYRPLPLPQPGTGLSSTRSLPAPPPASASRGPRPPGPSWAGGLSSVPRTSAFQDPRSSYTDLASAVDSIAPEDSISMVGQRRPLSYAHPTGQSAPCPPPGSIPRQLPTRTQPPARGPNPGTPMQSRPLPTPAHRLSLPAASPNHSDQNGYAHTPGIIAGIASIHLSGGTSGTTSRPLPRPPGPRVNTLTPASPPPQTTPSDLISPDSASTPNGYKKMFWSSSESGNRMLQSATDSSSTVLTPQPLPSGASEGKSSSHSAQTDLTAPFVGRENASSILEAAQTVFEDDRLAYDMLRADLAPIDKAVRAIKRINADLPPEAIAVQYITRAFSQDLAKARAIFIWIAEHIIWDSGRYGDIASRDNVEEESAASTLRDRRCRRDGFAKLFHAMASAVGLQCGLVRGYLKGPTDSLDDSLVPPLNHCWNVIKIHGEYRFVDVGRAVPSHPYAPRTTKPAVQTHYFLAQPKQLIYTHLPSDPSQQYILPPISPRAFHSLPYVTGAYWDNGLEFINFRQTVLELRDQETAQLVLKVNDGVSCYAEVDTIEHGKIHTISQCVYNEGQRLAKILVRMKGHQARGFLRIHAGHREFDSKGRLKSDILPLAMVVRIQHTGHTDPPDFAILHPTPHEFYIREPLNAELRFGASYHFHVQSVSDTKHQKLSLRAPSTKDHNFVFFPADGAYILDLTIKEPGQWALVYVSNRGGRRSVATYHCSEAPVV